ncbi:potassium channel family protein [Iamia majanohamensis]|uniref:Potassium channel family protein n=1 Tax=Iamia majanohamensis TaxID=467976 RepID=A0AAE9YAL4_9ACTN|nr:potassium channel family protein [Iamia majanohamensis]WCO68911.1 potassium channel family protein [Iamia majanohamensis]
MGDEVGGEEAEEVRVRSALWALVCCVVMAAGFAVAPLEGNSTWVVIVLVLVLTTVIGAPFFLIRKRLDHTRRPLADALVTVVLMLVTLVVGFSAVYVTMAHEDPDGIPGIDTKVDAVYFTVTTLATVGYGDIHPVSQSARVVATIQMLFDLTVVAVAARLVLGVAQERRRERVDRPR